MHAASPYDQHHSDQAIDSTRKMQGLRPQPDYHLQPEQIAFEDLQHAAMHAGAGHQFTQQPAGTSNANSQRRNDYLWQQPLEETSTATCGSSSLSSPHHAHSSDEGNESTALMQQSKPDAESNSEFDSQGSGDQISSQLAGLRRRSALRRSK